MASVIFYLPDIHGGIRVSAMAKLLSHDDLRYCVGMDASLIMLITSVNSQPIAESLARNMVRQRLAACVQVSAPATSVYHWKGNIESAEEYNLSIKTTSEKLDETIVWLHQHHPYEVPELIWWPVHASDGYAGWACESVDQVPDEGDNH